MANSKLPLRIQNPTKYFLKSKDRSIVIINSPDSYKAICNKRIGYENRLYYEYLYCKENNGQTFYFTLTYCDDKVPKYLGQNCFDYEDVCWLLNGGFKKKLLRNYGTIFKYFVGAELGEGAGKRGFENNPHYHILFFLRPDSSGKFPYKRIKPEEFRHILRQYWQGFDEDTDGWHDYKKSRFGIVKEGKYGIEVSSFHACTYVAKYVTKDIRLKRREGYIRRYYTELYSKKYNSSNYDVQLDFLRLYMKNLSVEGEKEFFPSSNSMADRISQLGLEKQFIAYCKDVVNSLVDYKINEYRNRYCNKCRISQGVGDYALNFIDSSGNDLSIKVPSKNGFQSRPINLYYYRKLFTDVVTSPDGKPIRILNQKGIDYKSRKLQSQLTSLAEATKAIVIALTEDFYNRVLSSDCNDGMTNMSFLDFQSSLTHFNIDNLYQRYAVYKLVYENRFTRFFYDGLSRIAEFPALDFMADYRRFLKSSILTPEFNPCCADFGTQTDSEGFISYSAHPYFRAFIGLFSVFDLLSLYLFVKTDDKKESDSKERELIRNFHKKNNMSKYFSRKCL